jgi:hypothetical protein
MAKHGEITKNKFSAGKIREFGILPKSGKMQFHQILLW